MARLRADTPSRLGGADVVSAVDLLVPGPDGLPPTDGLALRTADDVRVVIRPSGTEPKLKCYLEAVVILPASSPSSSDDLDRGRAPAAARLAAVRADLDTVLLPPPPP